jgi:hypothetical protein
MLYEAHVVMQNQNTNTVLTVVVVITTFTAMLQLDSTNLAFSQAVDLIPINTGNETLDGGIPLFYQCIEEAVDASKNAPEQESYFENEPTKNEMRECYRAVFVDKSIEEVNNADIVEEEVEVEMDGGKE